MKRQRGGSLSAVGIGIRAPAQTTLEASMRIEQAEKVFSLVADPFAEYWIRTKNGNTESLAGLYAVGKERRDTYREMVERVLAAVRENRRVCVVSYGHPGVAAYPLHESVRRARAEGFPAEMLAAVSAEDCLFADLGIDPVASGCCSYEATDFLLRRRAADPASNLILWQVGVIAEAGFKRQQETWNRAGLAILAEALLEVYPPEHEVVVYDAPKLPIGDAVVERVALRCLSSARMSPMSTLFVPPAVRANVDEVMLQRLGICRRSREREAAHA